MPVEDLVPVKAEAGNISDTELRICLVSMYSARSVHGSVEHALSPFHTDDLDGILVRCEPWQGPSGAQGCYFALTEAHLLHRR